MAAVGCRCISACLFIFIFGFMVSGLPLEAATIIVPAGGNLQQALNAAQPGDTILLAEGAEFVGNFVLPAKSGTGWITVRSSAPDSVLPGEGTRIQPAHSPLLPRLRSPNSMAALRTAAGAHHWALRYLEFAANQNGYGDIIQLGDGSSAQNTLASVPHDLVLSHILVRGDVRVGQKRCIALNAAQVTIRDSHVSECKGVAQDTQAICGWNGPGPYVIENNHLEAAGEVVMFGGADPPIADLVPSGITFRRNYLTRPMSWRQPILGTPAGMTAELSNDGSLPAGTYAYRIVARGNVGQGSTGRSTASAEVLASLPAAGAVRIQWQPVAGASEYRVYGRTAGSQSIYWTVTGTEFVDTGAAGTSEAVPTTTGTVWTVKNVFELKNARDVLIEGNIFENHWKQAQPGWAIVLTPRNSNGACTWCVVERVRFEYNIVRNVAAGINLLGYDVASRPTRQSNDIVIRQNLFHGLMTSLGGNGWFMQIGDEPRDLTIEHNTIQSNGSAVVYTYGGTSSDPREIYGLRMVANAAKHGSYGFNGAFFSYGNGILAGFYPGYVFTANYLAGGAASRYPAGNLFSGVFEDQFVDAASQDYRLSAASILRGAAPDGTDVGVDAEELGRRILGVSSGLLAAPPDPPRSSFTFSCSGLTCTFTSTSVAGANPITTHAWTFGDGTSGSGATATRTFETGGTFTVALTVSDGSGLTSTSSQPVTVVANAAPMAGFASSCTDLVCSFVDQSQDADGRIDSVSWSFGDGTTALASPATHRFATPAAYTITLTVTDNGGASASTTRSIEVRARAHAALLAGSTTQWTRNRKTYWSAEVVVGVHGSDERPIAGATLTVQWTGAVVRTASCVTGADGRCTFASGTLSDLKPSVTLAVTGISATLSDYDSSANHTQTGALGSSLTLNRP